MLKTLERLMAKLLGNTRGHHFNMYDWDIMSLHEHYRMGRPLKPQEVHAVAFLEQVGEWMDLWDPPEKRKRPYGQTLNETRKLH